MVNHHIDNAISLLEHHQNYIELYEDVCEMDGDVDLDFTDEDRCGLNKNFINLGKFGDHFVANCQKELEYHQHELEKARVRMRICMLTFKKGWIF